AELEVLTGLLQHADRATIDRAVQAASGLPPLRECDNAATLRAHGDLPRDPALRREAEALSGALAQARALRNAGHTQQSVTQARRVAERARDIGYRSLAGRAWFLVGVARAKAGEKGWQELLLDSLLAAEAAGDAKQAALTNIQLSFYLADHEDRFDEAA